MRQINLKKIFLFIYQKMIVRRKQEIMFWILYSFIITFLVSRLFVYLAPNFSVFHFAIKNVHVHHFVPGFIILAIAGIAALNDFHHKKPRLVAIIYGIGLGWSFDEFAMWLYLDDDYWMRRSYDAIVVIGAILISSVYFKKFWEKLFEKLQNIIFERIKSKIKYLILSKKKQSSIKNN